MTQSNPSSSSIVSTVAGMGLFLATAAVSQWIQNHHRLQQEQHEAVSNNRRQRKSRRRIRRDASRSTSCEGEGEDEDWLNYTSPEEYDVKQREKTLSTQAFRRRRIHRRLSFQQFGDDETNQSQHNSNSRSNKRQGNGKSIDGDAQQRGNRVQARPTGSPETLTEWSRHHSMQDLTSPQGVPSKEMQTHQREKGTIRRGSFRSPISNGRYHDFHPKYQNWRHFEHFNEHDRAKQRRKAQLLKRHQHDERQKAEQIQRQLLLSQQQRSCRQQDAGEGASQKEDGEAKRQNFEQFGGTLGITQNRQRSENDVNGRSRIDDGSDEESMWTNGDESDNNNSKNDDSLSSSCDSFGSANQYVWTGNHICNHHHDESSKSSPKSLNGSSSLNQYASYIAPIEPSASTSNINRNDTLMSNTSKDNRMGKFERFYRMLTSSVIDDDSELIESSSANVHGISLSSSITNPSSTTEYDWDVEDRHRALRTEYNAQIMPEKLVLIRHGQSMGNLDETIFATTPDNAMPLTDLGWEQARKAGTILKDKIITPGESVHFIVSPYVRTVETFHGIVSAWCDPDGEEFVSIKDHNLKVNAWYERLTELGLTWNEDSRIREQDFGNYQTPEVTRRAKEERHRFGAFYYRFNNGESGSDVYDRVSTFLDSLWRSFETNKSQNYVLVTHGIVLRVLMARYFRYTISQLNLLANPRNCEMVVLGHAGDGRLDLEGRCALELEEDPETHRSRVKGYKFHKRLRILPKSHVRTVRFRISPRDHTAT